MKNDYITRAQQFIKSIYPFIMNCWEENEIYNAVAQYNYIKHRRVSVKHGATRMVLITSDYVIKFDFGMADRIRTFGGCEKEMELYSIAEADGFEYLFAKITRFDYFDYVFYIMPRIHGIGRTEYDADEYMTNNEWCWCRDHRMFDLHNLNYGWRDGHICLIDYAAYNE